MIFNGYTRCSTSRKAEKWLQDRKIAYEFKDLKEFPPSVEELKKWHKMSGVELKRFFNTSGIKYRELKLKDRLSQMSDEEKYELLSSDGMLVKRPLVIDDDTILIGFKETEWEKHFKTDKTEKSLW